MTWRRRLRSLESDRSLEFDHGFDRTTTVVLAMLALDVVWWWVVLAGHAPTPGASWLTETANVPMAAPGALALAAFHAGTIVALAGYAVTWGVMMWAMMLPTMTRFTRSYAAGHFGGPRRTALAVAAFLVGYHFAWLSSAALPLVLHAVLPGGIYGAAKAHTALVVGGALAFAGLYQLSSFKQSYLRSCCANAPLHDDGAVAALREGLDHGVRCVLVTFGLFFVLMPVFGTMNAFWMVALAGVAAVERLPAWGDEIATATGVLALVAGLVVLLAHPDLGIAFVA